ncbi:MAG: YbjQ family protein [Helicobacteraceae bacterium]|jgi:uncharacterized protein YbjQ (UPF0145 family)|nr:YbjQ family protein [Helicobacteraceae bacterium]
METALIVQLIPFAVLLIIGFAFGAIAEKRHYRSIIAREKRLSVILTFSQKTPPPMDSAPRVKLVVGSVVVSSDYFRSVSAFLRGIFGGRIRSYESLLDRARREAVLRMKQSADEFGAKQIYNVKIETSMIGGDNLDCVEAYAYGTALRPR